VYATPLDHALRPPQPPEPVLVVVVVVEVEVVEVVVVVVVVPVDETPPHALTVTECRISLMIQPARICKRRTGCPGVRTVESVGSSRCVPFRLMNELVS
jgi:hypothetical protein